MMTTKSKRKERKIIEKLLAKPIAKIEITDPLALNALAYPKVGIFHAGHIEAFVKSPDLIDANLLSIINQLIAANKSSALPYKDAIVPFSPDARSIHIHGKPSDAEARRLSAKYKALLKAGNANLPAKTVLLNIGTLAPLATLHAVVDATGREFRVRLYNTFDISRSTDTHYNYVLTRLMDITLRQDMDGGFTAIGSNWNSVTDPYPPHNHPSQILGLAIAEAIVISSEAVAA